MARELLGRQTRYAANASLAVAASQAATTKRHTPATSTDLPPLLYSYYLIV